MGRRAEAIPGLYARPPTPYQDFFHLLSPFTYVPALEGIEARHEARVFYHEGHQLCRVTADAEEFKFIFLNE
jgi:hypothetical protein